MRDKKQPKPHLEIQKFGNIYYGVIRTTFRENGKIKHTTHGTIKGKTYEELKVLQAAFRGEVIQKSSIEILQSKEYGASYSLLQMAKELELDKEIYSRSSEQWVKDVMAMIVGRVVYAGSKLSLSHRYEDTALWEISGVEGEVDVDKHCYDSMDKLLLRQKAIQEKLAKKHLKNGSLVLYDITSSYTEGEYEGSDIVRYGYNRDGKKGHEQLVIGLLCSAEGCPVGVEVFPGNTQDRKTVIDKIDEVQKAYGIKEIIFVGDRGMVTKANYEKVKDIEGLSVISALTHRQVVELLRRQVVQVWMFDERDIVEVIDPEDIGQRYCLCRNEKTALRDTKTRESLLQATAEGLVKIQEAKRRAKAEEIGKRVGRVLEKTKMGKFVDWQIDEEGRLKWGFREDKIRQEQVMDGCYIINSNVSAEQMDKHELVASYKKLTLVEEAFRNLKTVRLEVRPVYHKTDDRIRSHVFICMLAYYLQWHMNQRLSELYKEDGKGKDRKYTFEYVIERLKSIRREVVKIGGCTYKTVSRPDEVQKRILELMGVRL